MRIYILIFLFAGIFTGQAHAAEKTLPKEERIKAYTSETVKVADVPGKAKTKKYRSPRIEGNAVAALLLAFASILLLAIYPPMGFFSIFIGIICIIRARIKIKKEPKERWRGKKFTVFAIILISILLGILGAIIADGGLDGFF